MGRLPELSLQKAVSVLENFPEGCLEQLTWPSALLRKTVFHIPYISKRRRKVLKKKGTLFFFNFFFLREHCSVLFPSKRKKGKNIKLILLSFPVS